MVFEKMGEYILLKTTLAKEQDFLSERHGLKLPPVLRVVSGQFKSLKSFVSKGEQRFC
jgi:hypothetical protein